MIKYFIRQSQVSQWQSLNHAERRRLIHAISLDEKVNHEARLKADLEIFLAVVSILFLGNRDKIYTCPAQRFELWVVPGF